MPSPNRRNKGEVLAHQISDHSAARGVADDRDRLAATRARQDKKWASLSSVLDQRAEQGRAKPPIVALPPKRNRLAEMEVEVNQQNSAAAFRRVLDTPCPAHAASPGEPCWWPLDHAAMCGERIQRAGFNGVVTRARR
jgi:hypothetical protein